jgi:hypothetical protein
MAIKVGFKGAMLRKFWKIISGVYIDEIHKFIKTLRQELLPKIPTNQQNK